MEPMLHAHESMVDIEPTNGALCKKGDVVFFQRPDGSYVLHRITKVRAHDYLIWGDNVPHAEVVSHEAVFGILTRYNNDGQWSTLNDPQYRSYLRWLPFRRRWLHYRTLPKRCVRTLSRFLSGLFG